jgi:hypothetical protein
MTPAQEKVIAIIKQHRGASKPQLLEAGCDARAINNLVKSGEILVSPLGVHTTVGPMEPSEMGDLGTNTAPIEDEYSHKEAVEIRRQARIETEDARQTEIRAHGEVHRKSTRARDRQPQPCICGCGAMATGKIGFLAGHDAKLKSYAKKGCPTGGISEAGIAWLRSHGLVA